LVKFEGVTSSTCLDSGQYNRLNAENHAKATGMLGATTAIGYSPAFESKRSHDLAQCCVIEAVLVTLRWFRNVTKSGCNCIRNPLKHFVGDA